MVLRLVQLVQLELESPQFGQPPHYRLTRQQPWQLV